MDTATFISFCKNASENGTTDEMWQLGDDFRVSGMVLAIFKTLILLIGLPWNLMVIVTIVKEKLYKRPTIVLLLNLAFIDLLYIIILPIHIVVGAAGEFILGSNDLMRCNSCKLGLLDPIFPILLIYGLTFLSFDRFFYFYKPLHYKRIVTIPKILIAISLLWLFVLLIAMIPLFNFSTIHDKVFFYRPFAACVLNIPLIATFLVMAIVMGLPLIVLIVCNVWVVYIVQKTIRRVYTARSVANNHRDKDFHKKMKQIRKKKQFHMIKVFGGLIISSLISWLPMIILVFLLIFTEVTTVYQAIALVLFEAQVVIHPILEATLIRDVRKPFMNMLCCCFENSALKKSPKRSCSQYECCTVFCAVISEASSESNDTTTNAPTSYDLEPSPHITTTEPF